MVFLHFVFLSQVFFYGLTDTFSFTFDPSLLRIVAPTSASPPPLAAVWRAVAMRCPGFQTSVRTIDRPTSSFFPFTTRFSKLMLSFRVIWPKYCKICLSCCWVQLYKDGFIGASGPRYTAKTWQHTDPSDFHLDLAQHMWRKRSSIPIASSNSRWRVEY